MADAAVAGGAQKSGSVAAHWPPIVYFVLGFVCLLFWAGGTAVQVQTSEAWIMGTEVHNLPTVATFVQIWLFISGQIPSNLTVPVSFAWGVQIALVLASVGIELPRYPKWRYYGAWGLILLLIGVNSAGDYIYSSPYGGWGQAGFTLVTLFITFFLGLLAIMCFVHGLNKMQGR